MKVKAVEFGLDPTALTATITTETVVPGLKPTKKKKSGEAVEHRSHIASEDIDLDVPLKVMLKPVLSGNVYSVP